MKRYSIMNLLSIKIICCCIFTTFLLSSCVSYVLSGFTVIEKSKFITPSWADKDSFFVYDDTLVYVEKLSKRLDLPLALKQAQNMSIENSKRRFSSYLNDALTQKIESNGIKIPDKSVIKQISSQQNVYVKNIVLKDIYYEKIAGDGSNKDYYIVYVLDQITQKDYMDLCSSIIRSFKRQSVAFKGIVDLLNKNPNNCLAE